jgi:hypothetical protein
VADGLTILQRMVAAQISEERALMHLRGQWVRLDGQIVTDPDHPAGGRMVISPPPVTDGT